MKLEKAIELLEEHAHLAPINTDPDTCDALKMAVQALKLIYHTHVTIDDRNLFFPHIKLSPKHLYNFPLLFANVKYPYPGSKTPPEVVEPKSLEPSDSWPDYQSILD